MNEPSSPVDSIGWVARRLIASFFGGVVGFFGPVTFYPYSAQILVEMGLLERGDWFLDYNGRFEFAPMFLVGGVAGFLMPNVKLSRGIAARVLGPLIGVVLALFGMTLLDSALAQAAVDRVYGPYENVDSGTKQLWERPRPHQKGYPSYYGMLYPRGWVYGLIIGSLGAVAYLQRGRKRSLWTCATVAVALALMLEAGWAASIQLDAWISEQDSWLSEQEVHIEQRSGL